MVLGVVFFQRVYSTTKKFIRYFHHAYGFSFLLWAFVGFNAFTYALREPMTYMAYRKFQRDTKKKAQGREEELRQYSIDQTFLTMDDQKIKLAELDTPFVILIKSNTLTKLNNLTEVLGELKQYDHISFILLKDFNNPEIINSQIAKHAFFVTTESTGEQTLTEDTLYLLSPKTHQLLGEISIPEVTVGLSKTIKLKMNKKLDQVFKRSINFQAK